MAKGLMLYDIPLSNKYQDIPRFTNDTDVDNFLHDYQGFLFNDKPFNIAPFGSGNELVTQLVVDSATYGVSRNIIMNANYLVVSQSKEHEFFLPRLYYFITDIEWLGGRLINDVEQGKAILHLELDVATTFKLCGKVTADEEIFTERRHTSRFVQVDDGYMFDDKEVLNGDPLDSQFQADIPEKPVYYEQNENPFDETNLITSSPIPLTRTELQSFLGQWDWEIIVTRDKITNTGRIPLYKYSTCSVNGVVNVQGDVINEIGNEKSFEIDNDKGDFDTSIFVYLSPVYKNPKPLLTNSTFYNQFLFGINDVPSNRNIHAQGITPIFYINYEKDGPIILSRFRLPINFLYQFASSMFAKCLVDVPDLDVRTAETGRITTTRTMIGIRLEDNENYVIVSEQGPTSSWSFKLADPLSSNVENPFDKNVYSMLMLTHSSYDNGVFTYRNNTNEVSPFFDTLPSVSSLKDDKYEPKLMIEPYATYTIKSKLGTPNGFNFNPLLIETDLIEIILKYVPNVSTAKFSLFVKPYTLNPGVYDESITSPYYNLYALNVGDINISDYTLPIKSDPFYQMALEQRNYRTTGLAVPVISSLTQSTGLLGATTIFNPEAMLSSVAGASIGVSSAISATGNYFAHIDNLKNAPDSIQNSGNDALHDACLGQDLRPYLSVYRLKKAQRKQVFDYYYRMGYSVETYEDMRNWFVRQIFNYIKTNDGDLENKLKSSEIVLPNFIRRALADILNNGVTFWEMGQINKFMSRKYENVEYANKIPISRL